MRQPNTTAAGSTARRRAYIIVAVVLGLALGVAAFALPSLVGPWIGIPGREAHRVHDLGWGALGGVILTVGLLAQLRPERAVAPLQGVVAGLVALMLAWAISGELLYLAIPVAAGALLVGLHPRREDLLGRGPRISIPLGAIALVAAVPLIVYALDQAAFQRACGPVADTHCQEMHWASMAALGFGLPLAGVVASLGAPGWRLLAWLTGLAAVVFGLSSVVFPNLASSVGGAWGTVAIAGGVLFIAAAEWEARRASHRTPR